jgi:hypothetical protein
MENTNGEDEAIDRKIKSETEGESSQLRSSERANHPKIEGMVKRIGLRVKRHAKS